jgi:hypothetical protein
MVFPQITQIAQINRYEGLLELKQFHDYGMKLQGTERPVGGNPESGMFPKRGMKLSPCLPHG